MNILLLLAHAIEEHDQLKLLSGLGYDVFSIGGYIDPRNPHDPKRSALPDVPFHPELKAVVDNLGTADNLRAAKDRIPDELIDWADTIIVHHYEHTWIVGNWNRIKHKRVIWRTVGQSVENNERLMTPYRKAGLEIVRYSPKERNIPGYAGEDALIRFYKDPAEWNGWIGDEAKVINFAQGLFQREPYTNYRFWELATKELPREAMGPGSEAIGGRGEQSPAEMLDSLRHARCYLYTGTQPASYTLGLIEAMMVGIPVVSIGPTWMRVFPYGPDLFEGHEIVDVWPTEPADANTMLRHWLDWPESAAVISRMQRARAIELFGKDTIAAQWADYLGGSRIEFSTARETVTA